MGERSASKNDIYQFSKSLQAQYEIQINNIYNINSVINLNWSSFVWVSCIPIIIIVLFLSSYMQTTCTFHSYSIQCWAEVISFICCIVIKKNYNKNCSIWLCCLIVLFFQFPLLKWMDVVFNLNNSRSRENVCYREI